MPLRGRTAGRGHLRLVTAAGAPHSTGGLAGLAGRAIAAAATVLWTTSVAWAGAALALLPVLWRRAMRGRRLRQQPPREAQVIPFQRRRALPR